MSLHAPRLHARYAQCTERLILIAAAAVMACFAVSAAPADAQTAPVRGPAPESAGNVTAPVFVPTAGPAIPYSDAVDGPLFFQRFAPAEPNDRGSTFTDAGAGLPYPGPNADELQKLAMARAAIEASRNAGTLVTVGPAEIRGPTDPAVLERIKQESLRTVPESPVAPLPEACVGSVPPSVQIPAAIGSDGKPLTEAGKGEK